MPASVRSEDPGCFLLLPQQLGVQQAVVHYLAYLLLTAAFTSIYLSFLHVYVIFAIQFVIILQLISLMLSLLPTTVLLMLHLDLHLAYRLRTAVAGRPCH